jgi:hypothetical protein
MATMILTANDHPNNTHTQRPKMPEQYESLWGEISLRDNGPRQDM